MRNIPKALVLLCALAALCGCDPDTGATPDDGGVFPDGASASGQCDGTDDGICPCASATNGGRRYLFCLDIATWEQARDRCAEYGYELVRIESESEQQFVWSSGVDVVGENNWWIGLNDQAAEGEFVWSNGAALGGYAPWAPMQPDQGGAEIEIEEDCVEMHSDHEGGWNDLDCATDYLDFICERGE